MVNEKRYRFEHKQNARGGVFAAEAAAASLILFAAACLISFFYDGTAGIRVGVFGLVGLPLAAVGFIAGLKSFKEPETSILFPVVGSVGAGVMAVVWLIVFLSGIR